MTYSIIYEPDYSRIMMAVIIDARATIPEIKNQVGSVIKSYVDSKVALVSENTIFYKIETDQGVMAGYFTIEVNTANKTALLGQFLLRPAFVKFSGEITNIITNFIALKKWQKDYLF